MLYQEAANHSAWTRVVPSVSFLGAFSMFGLLCSLGVYGLAVLR